MGVKGVFLTDRSADCSRIYLGKVPLLVASLCPLSPLSSSPLSVILCISYPTSHTDTRTGGEQSWWGSSMQYQTRHLDIPSVVKPWWLKHEVVQHTIEPDTYTKFIQLGSTFFFHHLQTRVLSPSTREIAVSDSSTIPVRSKLLWSGFPAHFLHGQLHMVAHLGQCIK